jgi:hypothetical protein
MAVFRKSIKEKNEAVCKICGRVLSLGSEKPKLQTTTGLKLHLKSKRQNDFVNLRTFLRIFVHLVSVLVFGLRPDIFPARYSVSA